MKWLFSGVRVGNTTTVSGTLFFSWGFLPYDEGTDEPVAKTHIVQVLNLTSYLAEGWKQGLSFPQLIVILFTKKVLEIG